MTPGLRHAMRPIVTLAVIGAVVALVACGGGEESADAEASFEDAQLEFAECMRENGVDVPDPETSGDGGGFLFGPDSGIDPDSDSFQAAQEECGSILDEAIPEGERPDSAEIQDQLHLMTECLRDKGYDVPEPQIVTPGDEGDGPSGGPGEFSAELEQLQDDPEFQQGQEDCSSEAGLEGGPGAGPPGGPDGAGG